VWGYAFLVDLYQAQGNVETAREVLRKLVRIHLTPGFSLPDTPVAAMIAERSLLLSRSRPDPDDLFAQAVEWAERSGLRLDDAFRHQQEYEYCTLARVRIAQGRAAEVVPLLDRLIASAESAGRNGQLIVYLALQAVAHHAGGRTDTALVALSRALALGESEDYVRTFLDLGPPMQDLLRQAPDHGMATAYVDRLLAAMEGTTKDQGRKTDSPLLPQALHPSSVVGRSRAEILSEPKGRPSSPLVEPLNDREMQILRLIAAGLSDRVIAEELYLSIHTIRWYNRQIYGKLGVNRRGQAVARARELGILRDG
jgi:LuxR family maltose regulon positive regulatory protein